MAADGQTADVRAEDVGPAPFTASMGASETLQAQQSRSNDSPTDVNNNAADGRLQSDTTGQFGAEMAACGARRTIQADHVMHLLGVKSVPT